MNYSIFFPALSQVSPLPNEKWRIATKTASLYNTYLSCEGIFRYYNRNSEFNLTNKRMTIFHFGTISTSDGYAVILKRGSSDTDPIQIGLMYSDGTNWSEISSSFVSLNSIGNVDNDAFYYLFTYDYSGNNSNKKIQFHVVQYNNTTTKTTPDFSYTNSAAPAINVGNQWGFGSAPESITTTDGLVTPENYNSYVAQNVELMFLRTWNRNPIISTSSSTTTYAMFNSSNPSYSLYELNKSYTQVPSGTTGLNFQLKVTGTTLSDIYNSGENASTSVTLTNSTSSYPTLDGFAINNSTNYVLSQNTNIPCLMEGTKILTPNGYVNIENLEINDKLLTHDNRIVSITKFLKTPTMITKENNKQPYLIKKGLYNAFEDLYISPKHSLLIDNKYFNEAENLNLERYTEEKIIVYYNICLENYLSDTIVANGVIVESWCGLSPNQRFIVPQELINENNKRIILNK